MLVLVFLQDLLIIEIECLQLCLLTCGPLISFLQYMALIRSNLFKTVWPLTVASVRANVLNFCALWALRSLYQAYCLSQGNWTLFSSALFQQLPLSDYNYHTVLLSTLFLSPVDIWKHNFVNFEKHIIKCNQMCQGEKYTTSRKIEC